MGKQLLETAPTPLLSGASTVSLSLRVRVNPGSVVADPDGVLLLGDAAGRLAVGLTAGGRLRASWSGTDAPGGPAPAWSQRLVEGANYHLAVAWQDGDQRFYINGLLVHSDARRATPGHPVDGAPAPFRLGPGLAGADVTLDEPTLWVGHALTAAEVVSLRDRAADPSTIAPASVALRWTLAGADGVPARPGDAGLADGSSTGLDLTPVAGAAPVYQSGALTYSLLDGGCSAMVAPSGEGIVFAFHDEATNPTGVTGVVPNNEVQSVTVAAIPPDYATSLPFTLSFGGRTTAPIRATPGPTLNYWQWNVTGLPPGTYAAQMNTITISPNDPAAILEFFDGPKFLTSTTINQQNGSGNAGPVADPSLLTVAGSPVLRVPIASNLAVTSGTLRVRLSCRPQYYLWANDLWVIRQSDGAVVQRATSAHPPATPSHLTPDADFVDYVTNPSQVDDGVPAVYMRGSGATLRYLVDPADVRAELEALPSIGAGNLSVTGDGSVASPILVTFLGALAGAPLTPMTCDLPASSIVVGEYAKGAILPSIRINGGSPIPLPRDWLYYTSKRPSMPTAQFFFPQAPPAVTYSVVRNRDNSVAGPGWHFPVITGFTGQVMASDDLAATAAYRYRPVGPGTYRVSATWPIGPGYTRKAIYTVADVNGAVLATVPTDQTVAPSGFPDAGVTWRDLGTFRISGLNNGLIVTQSNGGTAGMVSDALRFERVSADPSIRIGPGDVVTYSAGAGWAATTGAAAPAVKDAPVANRSGGALYPPLPVASKMKTGWNMYPNTYFCGSLLYANFARYIEGFGDYPTRIGGPVAQFTVTSCYVSYGADGRSWPNVPPGPYVLAWEGPTNLTLSCNYQEGFLVEDASRAVYPAPAGQLNRRYYTGSADAFTYGPQINLIIHGDAPAGDGNWTCSFSRLGIYPEGTDLENPPVFRPDGVARYRNARVIRHLDTMGAIAANPTVFSDYNPPPDRLSVGRAVRILTTPIHRIEPYTGPEFKFDPEYGVPYLFTAGDGAGGVRPHGLSQFQCVTIEGYTGPPADLVRNDGATQNVGFDGIQNYIYVVDDTRFVIYGDPRGGWKMTNVITDPGGSVVMRAGAGPAIRDMIALNNEVGADFYLPVAPTATDACLAELATYLATHLKPGLKLRVEFFNETWNFTAISGKLTLFAGMAVYGGPTNTSIQFACEGARHIWGIMKPAWVAAGRDPADFIRVIGTNHFDPSETQRVVGYCRSVSPPITFDELDGAPYLFNVPDGPLDESAAETAFSDCIDRMTAAQHLDMWESHWTFGGHGNEIKSHLDTLAAAGEPYASVTYGAYECGPDSPLIIGGTGVNRMFLVHSFWRHPRWFGLYQQVLRVYEESGCTTWHDFQLSHIDHPGMSGSGWAAYQTTAMLPYSPGDPAQDAIQIGQPDRLDLIRSVTGGAIIEWASKYLSRATPPPPPPPPPPRTTVARPRRFVPRRLC